MISMLRPLIIVVAAGTILGFWAWFWMHPVDFAVHFEIWNECMCSSCEFEFLYSHCYASKGIGKGCIQSQSGL